MDTSTLTPTGKAILDNLGIPDYEYDAWRTAGVADPALIADLYPYFGRFRWNLPRFCDAIFDDLDRLRALLRRGYAKDLVTDALATAPDLDTVEALLDAGVSGAAYTVCVRRGIRDLALIARLTEAGAVGNSDARRLNFQRPTTVTNDPFVYVIAGVGDPERWIDYATRGVTPSVADGFFRFGLHDLDIIAELVAAGIGSHQHRDYRNAGEYDHRQQIRFASHHIDGNELADYRASGLSDNDLIAAKHRRISGTEAAHYALAGIRTIDEMARRADADISGWASTVWRQVALHEPADIDTWRNRGLDTHSLQQCLTAGITDLTTALRIVRAGLNPHRAMSYREQIGYHRPLDEHRVRDLLDAVPASTCRIRSGGRMITITVDGFRLLADGETTDARSDAEAAFAALGGKSRLVEVSTGWRHALLDPEERISAVPNGLRDALRPARIAYIAAAFAGMLEPDQPPPPAN